MGYGLLFLGYFLLVNITFYGYTDLFCGMVLLYALSRLSVYNKPLRVAFYIAVGFTVYAIPEFLLSLLELFPPAPLGFTNVMDALLPVRYLLILALTVAVLWGVRTMAKEVALTKLSERIDCILIVPILANLMMAVLSIKPLITGMQAQTALGLTLIALTLFLVSVGLALYSIYTAYMRICLPEDVDMPERPSRFAFINRYRQRRDERAAEEAREREALLRRKLQNKKRKKK